MADAAVRHRSRRVRAPPARSTTSATSGIPGARFGRAHAMRSLFRFSFNGAFGVGRGEKAKSMPALVVLAVYLPAIVQIGSGVGDGTGRDAHLRGLPAVHRVPARAVRRVAGAGADRCRQAARRAVAVPVATAQGHRLRARQDRGAHRGHARDHARPAARAVPRQDHDRQGAVGRVSGRVDKAVSDPRRNAADVALHRVDRLAARVVRVAPRLRQRVGDRVLPADTRRDRDVSLGHEGDVKRYAVLAAPRAAHHGLCHVAVRHPGREAFDDRARRPAGTVVHVRHARRVRACASPCCSGAIRGSRHDAPPLVPRMRSSIPARQRRANRRSSCATCRAGMATSSP